MVLNPFKDYTPGQVLALNALRNHDGTSPAVLHVRIREFRTRTLSCTMVVEIVNEESLTTKGVAFLKLFDRRFSDSLRNQGGPSLGQKTLNMPTSKG